MDALHLLEAFASKNGPAFYGLPENTDTVTLEKVEWQVPDEITLATGDNMVPFFAGQTVTWKVKA